MMKKLLVLLLAALMIVAAGACQQTQNPPEKEPEPVEEPKEEEPRPESPVELPAPIPEPTEQADLTEADKMIQRLGENLRNPSTAVIRTKDQDSQIKIEITEELLLEIGGFLCQNYTVLETPIEGTRELESNAMIYVAGPDNASFVQVFHRRNDQDEREMIAWVQEGEVVAQYRYDYETYGALMEVLEDNEYENEVTLSGEYKVVRTTYDLEGFSKKLYNIRHVTQFGDKVMYCFSAMESGRPSYFEVVDGPSGKSVQSFAYDNPILDVQKTKMEDYDFYILSRDSIQYCSSENPNLKLDFKLPTSIKNKLDPASVNEKRFDLDYINDELVYVSAEGVVLSDKNGKRQDLLLRNDRLYELLNLTNDGDADFAPRYAAPKLMDQGRKLVCPILVPGSQDGWAGVTVFDLTNGTFKDHIGVFEPMIQEFTYPDSVTMVAESANGFSKMDVTTGKITRTVKERSTNENVFSYDMQNFLTYTTDMNYNGELYLEHVDTPQTQRIMLEVKGDYFNIYGVTETYVLCGYSDSYGSRLILLPYA